MQRHASLCEFVQFVERHQDAALTALAAFSLPLSNDALACVTLLSKAAICNASQLLSATSLHSGPMCFLMRIEVSCAVTGILDDGQTRAARRDRFPDA